MHGPHVVLLTALALWKLCLAEWNATDASLNQTASTCHLHGKKDNCTEKDTEQWSGHFSKCPLDLLHYCVHGECRYIKEQRTPSCKCQSHYHGARCEYVNLDGLKEERQQIIIGCSVAGLLFLMILVISFCICSHRRCRSCWWRRGPTEEPKNGTEKHGMLNTSTPGSTELTDTNSV